MKKNLFFMALAGAALASCVSDEVANLSQQEQEKVKISFDSPVAYSKVDSRVNYTGEIGSHSYSSEQGATVYSYPREESFIVYAVWNDETTGFQGWPETTGSNLTDFNGRPISYQDFVDGWAPLDNGSYYYWKDNKVLTYAAFSPAELDVIKKNGEVVTPTGYNNNVNVGYGEYDTANKKMGFFIDDFETPKNPALNYEVLYSPLNLNTNAENMNHDATLYSGLPIEFQRALTQIRFSIKTDIVDEYVYLHSIKLWGAKIGKANFRENIAVPNSWVSWTYASNPSWTFQDNPTKLVQGDNFIIYQKADGTQGARFIGEAKLVRDQMTSGDVLNHVFFIPQNFSDTNDDITIEVTYQIASNDPITKQYSLQNRSIEGGSAINQWVIGHRYTYRLYLSEAGAKKDKIMFSPSTENWTDVSGIVINL